MKLGILSHHESWYFRDLRRAATERGHRVECLDFPSLRATVTSGGERFGWGLSLTATPPPPPQRPFVETSALDRFNAIVVRTMPPGSLEQVVYRMNVLARAEALGTRIVNPPKALECAVDKYLTTARLAAAGLHVPDTVVCEDAEAALLAFDELGRDVVVKPLFGSEGRGIVRVSDVEIAQRVFRTLERIQAVLYLQRFVAHPGFDLRVLVLDGQVIGGMRRHGGGDFRTNISQNGRAEAWTPTGDDAAVSLAAVAATGAVFAGVDLLTDGDGRTYVIEVNAVPGWRAFAKATGIDVADRFVGWLEETC